MSDDNAPPVDGGDNGAPAPQEPNSPWTDSLPENVRGWDEAKNATDSESFWKQIADHRKHLGQSIRIPTDDAGNDTWSQFNEKLMHRVPGLMKVPDVDNPDVMAETMRKLGMPEESDGYGRPDTTTQMDDGKFSLYQQLAHGARMTKAQFDTMINGIAEMDQASIQQAENALTANKEAIESEWGAATKDRMGTIAKLAEMSGAPAEMQEMIKEGTISKDGAQWLYDLSKQLDGEALQVAHQQNNPTHSPSEAGGTIADIYANPDHPYHHTGHPHHQAARVKMHRLRLERAGVDPDSVPFPG